MVKIKQSQYKIKGMSRDLSLSAFNANFSYENLNVRITARDNNTLFSLENERGTKKVKFDGYDYPEDLPYINYSITNSATASIIPLTLSYTKVLPNSTIPLVTSPYIAQNGISIGNVQCTNLVPTGIQIDYGTYDGQLFIFDTRTSVGNNTFIPRPINEVIVLVGTIYNVIKLDASPVKLIFGSETLNVNNTTTNLITTNLNSDTFVYTTVETHHFLYYQNSATIEYNSTTKVIEYNWYAKSDPNYHDYSIYQSGKYYPDKELRTDPLNGIPLGYAVLGKYLTIFAKDNTVDSSIQDKIYRVLKNGDDFTFTLLYEGNLNFSLEHPIETLPFYENEDIQKVYWIDGLNQPRLINIVETNPEYFNSSFDFIPELDFKEQISISKVDDTVGIFPAGVIQYFFTYGNYNKQESNIFYQSPLYNISRKDTGGDEEDSISTAYNITINNIKFKDKKYDFVRIYSLIRTSLDGTPITKKLIDIPLNLTEVSPGIFINIPITYIDNNTAGEFIDNTELLYKQDNSIIPQTIAQKDNTLFLGNYTLNKKLFQVYQRNTTLFPIEFSQLKLYKENYNNNTYNKYNDLNDGSYSAYNNASVKTFKYQEWYRFGVQLVLKTGELSEPIFIQDLKNSIKPDTVYSNNGNFYSSGIDVYGSIAILNLNSSAINTLIADDVIGIKPLIVYPELKDRSIICQGIVAPTVFNMKSKRAGDIDSQSSWFFRPKGGKFSSIHGVSLYPNTAEFNSSDNQQGELVCNNYVFYSPVEDSGGTGDTRLSENGYFFIDESKVTLNSPELDFREIEDVSNIEGLKFRIIGYTAFEQIRHGRDINFITQPYSTIAVYDNTLHNTNDYRSFNQYAMTLGLGDGIGPCPMYAYPWYGTRINGAPSLDLGHYTTKKNIDFTIYGLNKYLESTSFWTPSLGIESVNFFNTNGLDTLSYNQGKIYAGNAVNYLGGFNYNEVTRAQGLLTANVNYLVSDAVTIKYKSNNHAFINFKASGTNINMLPYYKLTTEADQHFLNDNKNVGPFTTYSGLEINPVATALEFASYGSYIDDKPKSYIGELYRDDNSILNRFGGNTDETIINNKWVQCGDIIPLLDDNFVPRTSAVVTYTGDTYLQRYDCLKTYAYAEADYQSNVEIASFFCETRVNLGACQDKYRGTVFNKDRNPDNINVLNQVYQQENNYITYSIPDYKFFNLDNFPNSFTWTKTKSIGEKIDTWTSLTLASTLDANGALGQLRSIRLWNNSLIGFQDKGIFQILFNSNVQVATTNNLPIEIANSGKVEGIRYATTQIGTTNKWGIVESQEGLYFADQLTTGLYKFNGQLDNISLKKGFFSFMSGINTTEDSWTPLNFGNWKNGYDATNNDVYFINKDYCLVYSEQLGEFTSFYSYESTPYMFNIDGRFMSLHNEYLDSENKFQLWLQNKGEYNSFFGQNKGYYIDYIINPDIPYDKVFNNIEYRGDTFDSNGDLIIGETFNKLTVWDEYQTGSQELNDVIGYPSNLKQKFRVWRANIPRVSSINTTQRMGNVNQMYGMDRLRNTWCHLKLENYGETNNRHVLHDMVVKYTI